MDVTDNLSEDIDRRENQFKFNFDNLRGKRDDLEDSWGGDNKLESVWSDGTNLVAQPFSLSFSNAATISKPLVVKSSTNWEELDVDLDEIDCKLKI